MKWHLPILLAALLLFLSDCKKPDKEGRPPVGFKPLKGGMGWKLVDTGRDDPFGDRIYVARKGGRRIEARGLDLKGGVRLRTNLRAVTGRVGKATVTFPVFRGTKSPIGMSELRAALGVSWLQLGKVNLCYDLPAGRVKGGALQILRFYGKHFIAPADPLRPAVMYPEQLWYIKYDFKMSDDTPAILHVNGLGVLRDERKKRPVTIRGLYIAERNTEVCFSFSVGQNTREFYAK